MSDSLEVEGPAILFWLCLQQERPFWAWVWAHLGNVGSEASSVEERTIALIFQQKVRSPERTPCSKTPLGPQELCLPALPCLHA